MGHMKKAGEINFSSAFFDLENNHYPVAMLMDGL